MEWSLRKNSFRAVIILAPWHPPLQRSSSRYVDEAVVSVVTIMSTRMLCLLLLLIVMLLIVMLMVIALNMINAKERTGREQANTILVSMLMTTLRVGIICKNVKLSFCSPRS